MLLRKQQAEQQQQIGAPAATFAPEDAHMRQQIEQRLLAKRAEVLATQAKLESLSLEQRELERLYTRSIGKS